MEFLSPTIQKNELLRHAKAKEVEPPLSDVASWTAPGQPPVMVRGRLSDRVLEKRRMVSRELREQRCTHRCADFISRLTAATAARRKQTLEVSFGRDWNQPQGADFDSRDDRLHNVT